MLNEVKVFRNNGLISIQVSEDELLKVMKKDWFPFIKVKNQDGFFNDLARELLEYPGLNGTVIEDLFYDSIEDLAVMCNNEYVEELDYE